MQRKLSQHFSTTLQPLFASATALLLSLGLASIANADNEAPAHLPKAEKLLDKHVESTGGKAAHLAIKTRRKIGELAVDMTGHKFVATVKSLSKGPNQHHLTIEGDFFAQVNVCDGKNAWVWMPGHAGQGEGTTTLKTGDEKYGALADANLYTAVQWRKRFKSVETLGQETVADEPAYEVLCTPFHGEAYTQFFSKKSGRLVLRRKISPSDMGPLATETYFHDYRKIDDVWIAMRTETIIDTPDGQKGSQIWTYSSVEHDVKIAASLFKMPEELKGQLKAASKSESGSESEHAHEGSDSHNG